MKETVPVFPSPSLIALTLSWVMGGGFQAVCDAQVIADPSLSTQVSTSDGLNFIVTQGDRAQDNLFHSFEQLSIPSNGSLHFTHTDDVQSIFSRVTGTQPSNIDGSLNAGVDLYLLNPNGIVFGPDASLNLGGNLIASTAQEIEFADGLTFAGMFNGSSHQDLLDLPLLSVSQPVGLRLNAGSKIEVQARAGDDGLGNPAGLSFEHGGRLSLIGGELSLDQGHITLPGGELQLVALQEGYVSLSPSGAVLGVEDQGRSGNIRLVNGSRLNASGDGSNYVQLWGDRINLAQNSQILTDNLGSEDALGIQIKANQLNLSEQSRLNSSAYGSGHGGAIQLTLQEGIQLIGTGYDNLQNTFVLGALSGQLRLKSRSRLTGIITGTAGEGASGAITINSPNLQLQNGSSIWAPTFGAGRGGDINLQISEHLEHRGSNIATSTYATAPAGSLMINASQIDMTHSALINTSTFSEAPAGHVQIEAEVLMMTDSLPNSILPTVIFSSSVGGSGLPGDIAVRTNRFMADTGAQITSTGGVDLGAELTPTPLSGGAGGSVSLTARDRIVLSGTGSSHPTQLSVTSYSPFPAGQLEVSAPRVLLQDGARLLANSNAGEGGNIQLHANDVLLLEDGSDIMAAARGKGNGGNVRLTGSTLLLLDDSRITANAERGLGGNIEIANPFLVQSDDSIITASSALGQEFGGTVNLLASPVNAQAPFQAFSKTPFTEPKMLAACSNSKDHVFTVSGRGGLQKGANQPLDSQPLWQDQPPANFHSLSSMDLTGLALVVSDPEKREAKQVRRRQDGVIELVADALVDLAGFSCPLYRSHS